jgi:hypothetical protein
LTFLAIWILSIVSATAHWILWPGAVITHVPWLLIGLIVFFIWGRDRRHRHFI